jgi:hypothetical protein
MAAIQPRKTEYNGTVFRSRIEARWAIFFNALDVQWVYELQHYDFGMKMVWDDKAGSRPGRNRRKPESLPESLENQSLFSGIISFQIQTSQMRSGETVLKYVAET